MHTSPTDVSSTASGVLWAEAEDEVGSTPLAVIALPPAEWRAGRRRWSLRALQHRVLARGAWTVLGRGLLALPLVVVAGTVVWSVAAAAGSLSRVVRLVVALQFDAAAGQLPSLDTAGRVLMASAGYFAVLLTLRVLARGLVQQGWARLRLVLGIALTLPSLWLFAAGSELAAGVAPLAFLPVEVIRLVIVSLLAHSILLAVIAAARRPVGEAEMALALLSSTRATPSSTGPTPALAVVRFGPSAGELPSAATPAAEAAGRRETPGPRVSGMLRAQTTPPAS